MARDVYRLFVCNQPYGLLAGSLTVNVETCCFNMVVVVVLYVCELECVCENECEYKSSVLLLARNVYVCMNDDDENKPMP